MFMLPTLKSSETAPLCVGFNTGSMNTLKISAFSSSMMHCLFVVGAHLTLHSKVLQNRPTSSLNPWPFTGYL